MSAAGSQIWICTICDEQRIWGDGFPEQMGLFVLNCRYCHKVTPHKFLRVDHDEPERRHNRHITRDAAPLPYDRDGFQQKKEAL